MKRPSLRPTRTAVIAAAVTVLLGAGTAVAAARLARVTSVCGHDGATL
jgi:hypothetical protein